jgi:hypothetical protein
LGEGISRDPIGERGGLNLYGFVGNRPINEVDFLGLIAAGDVIKTKFGDVRIIRRPTAVEQDMGNKGVCLVTKLIGDAYYPPWNVVWIADMAIEGLNYRAGWFSKDRTEYIFIEKSKVPTAEWQLAPMLAYGTVLAHESDHYFADSNDPETGHRINDRVQEAARKAQAEKIECKHCIYTSGLWKIRNLLEKYACECGLDLSKAPGRDPLK